MTVKLVKHFFLILCLALVYLAIRTGMNDRFDIVACCILGINMIAAGWGNIDMQIRRYRRREAATFDDDDITQQTRDEVLSNKIAIVQQFLIKKMLSLTPPPFYNSKYSIDELKGFMKDDINIANGLDLFPDDIKFHLIDNNGEPEIVID